MSIAQRLEGRRVIICAGSGGVGKTTTSAAIALGLAAQGRRVAVVTIDPAKRLADALGIEELGSDPARVDPARLAGHGLEITGELWAMTLHHKRTFDELIERLAPDARARDEILGNRIYQELSSAVAGSQEFMAIAKLYELDRSGRFDAIVLDTPPSRNALDFLDAPERIGGFLDARAFKLFMGTGGLAAKLAARGTGMAFGILKRLTGVDLMRDLTTFFGALSTVLDGFRERATAVGTLLSDPATTFLVVTSPERVPASEAVFFHERLRDAGMPFGGLIVNRLHPLSPGDAEAVDLAAALGDEKLAAKVERSACDMRLLAERDAAITRRLRDVTGDDEPVLIPQLGAGVHDVDGLVAVCDWLFAPADERAQRLSAAGF